MLTVPRKVLRESFDMPSEADEQNQQRSDYDNELDEDDGHYKEAIPPAPKLQGTIPRTDGNTTQTGSTKGSTISTVDAALNQHNLSEGRFVDFSDEFI